MRATDRARCWRTAAAVALWALFFTAAHAQELQTGPVIDRFGPVFPVPEGSFNLVPGETYKIAFDIGGGPSELAASNGAIESAARFLNLQARNGIEPENLQLAIVLHGTAARAALKDEAHSARHEAPNGSRELIEALSAAGVRIYLCGQSAAARGFTEDELLPEITTAVSAMTAHVRLQQEGFRIIPF